MIVCTHWLLVGVGFLSELHRGQSEPFHIDEHRMMRSFHRHNNSPRSISHPCVKREPQNGNVKVIIRLQASRIGQMGEGERSREAGIVLRAVFLRPGGACEGLLFPCQGVLSERKPVLIRCRVLMRPRLQCRHRQKYQKEISRHDTIWISFRVGPKRLAALPFAIRRHCRGSQIIYKPMQGSRRYRLARQFTHHLQPSLNKPISVSTRYNNSHALDESSS